jgi:hypothetical protein
MRCNKNVGLRRPARLMYHFAYPICAGIPIVAMGSAGAIRVLVRP